MTQAPETPELHRARQQFQSTADTVDRLLGAVAHQTGAVMLPTQRQEPDLAEHRAWKRLQFATGAMTEHIRGQKFALDQLRGSSDPDASPMDAAVWMSWIPQLLEGLVPSATIHPSFQLQGPTPPGLARALALLWVWLDACSPGTDTIAVSVTGVDGRYGMNGTPTPSHAQAMPAALTEAWSSLGELTVSHETGLLALSVER